MKKTKDEDEDEEKKMKTMLMLMTTWGFIDLSELSFQQSTIQEANQNQPADCWKQLTFTFTFAHVGKQQK